MTVVIFDCDGVLAETERDGHRVAFNRAFEEHGIDLHWDDATYARLLSTGGGKERLRRALAARGEPDERLVASLHRAKSRIFVELVESGAIVGRPGVRRIVGEGLDAGWRFAVASTSQESSVRAVLDTAVGPDLARGFSGVFAGDVVERKKPAPDIYRLALRELGTDAASAVVVEDSAIGARAAAAAGLAHLVTVSAYTRDEQFPAAACVVTSLGDSHAPASILGGALDPPPGPLVGLADLRRCISVGVPTSHPPR